LPREGQTGRCAASRGPRATPTRPAVSGGGAPRERDVTACRSLGGSATSWEARRCGRDRRPGVVGGTGDRGRPRTASASSRVSCSRTALRSASSRARRTIARWLDET
jgi:hypothetical protein